MSFFNVATEVQAKAILKKWGTENPAPTESLSLAQCLGRFCAENIRAEEVIPRFDRSTVDGYAVRSCDVMGAGESIPAMMRKTGSVAMGELAGISVCSGEAVYVPTGAMVPEGADTMVMIEDCLELEDGTVLVHRSAAPGDNISYKGDDLALNEVLVEKGKAVSPYHIGLLAGLGIREIPVCVKPRIAIISTGDEILDISEPAEPGKIFDMNGYAIDAAARLAGTVPVFRKIVRDNPEELNRVLAEAVKISDIVLLSGGSSVGIRDFSAAAIKSLPGGKVHVHGIGIKPGKPTIIGTAGETIIFGLPGHPASALLIFHVFVRFLLKVMMGASESPIGIPARLSHNLHSNPGKTTYQMVQLQDSEEGWTAVPLHAKSGMMSLLAKASGYIIIDPDREGLAGNEQVRVFPFQDIPR